MIPPLESDFGMPGGAFDPQNSYRPIRKFIGDRFHQAGSTKIEGMRKQDRQMRSLNSKRSWNMNLGNFSVSLAVKDIEASCRFYEKLGFEIFGGDASQGWLIMKSPSCVIGLFQGMFEKNTLTFNPGWDAEGEALGNFTDVRDIQKALKADGIELISEADETTSGPASCMAMDPDGNPILIDQHV